MHIFISYRREDSEAYAGRMYDDLSDRFGADHVFMDVDTIEPGVDFVEVIQQAVSSCDVLIAVIGRRWLDVVDHQGQRRLDSADDFVRLEIATALERNIRVIPALVQGTTMPSPNQLPEALRRLTRRNAVELRHGSWRSDMQRLIAALEKPPRATAQQVSPPSPVEGQPASDESRLPASFELTESSAPSTVSGQQTPHRVLSRRALNTSAGIAAALMLLLTSAVANWVLNGFSQEGIGGNTGASPGAQLAASAAPNDQLAAFLSTVTVVAGRQQTALAQVDMTATAVGPTQTAQAQRTMTAQAVGRTQTAQAQQAVGATQTAQAQRSASPASRPTTDVGSANPEIVSNDQLLVAGDFQYGFSGLSNYYLGAYGGATPSRGRYLGVLATIRNAGDEPLQIPDGFFVVKDAQGRVYDFNRAASVGYFNTFAGSGDYPADAQIPPGAALGSMPLFFDVASDATNLVMFSRDNTRQGFLIRQSMQ